VHDAGWRVSKMIALEAKTAVARGVGPRDERGNHQEQSRREIARIAERLP